ncbi:low molecular weight phosphotyrosine protein phosphatase-like [Brevipalpus obovatus]|uniref:low molecular weight phosphotyrosine protein phosphatase-like n=1 Tax=Brevipalpus obovatus TaxID=246614 RepID=UPI003D9DC0B0
MGKKGVLMICLGNICRSTMAEAVFQQAIKDKGLEDSWFVDSAATSTEHIGGGPDHRTLDVLKKNGIKNYNHVVRQLKAEDFERFDWIFGMDDSNIRNIERKRPKSGGKAIVKLLGEFHPDGKRIIRDPWYDYDMKGFEECYDLCVASINNFLDQNK